MSSCASSWAAMAGVRAQRQVSDGDAGRSSCPCALTPDRVFTTLQRRQQTINTYGHLPNLSSVWYYPGCWSDLVFLYHNILILYVILFQKNSGRDKKLPILNYKSIINFPIASKFINDKYYHKKFKVASLFYL